MILGYDQATEWSADIANSMNKASHLWAPITSFVQGSVALLGTAVLTAVGFVAGAGAGTGTGYVLSTPYRCLKKEVEKNAVKYQKLETLISKAQALN